MKRVFLILCAALPLACQTDGPAGVTQIQTVESVPLQAAVLDPPPLTRDEPPPIPKKDPANKSVAPDEVSEAPRIPLPFAPAIAMDPVNGSKVSIRANTPILEYEKKLYYFSSEANKKTFGASPESFVKGTLNRY